MTLPRSMVHNAHARTQKAKKSYKKKNTPCGGAPERHNRDESTSAWEAKSACALLGRICMRTAIHIKSHVPVSESSCRHLHTHLLIALLICVYAGGDIFPSLPSLFLSTACEIKTCIVSSACNVACTREIQPTQCNMSCLFRSLAWIRNHG